jgi:predicted porin
MTIHQAPLKTLLAALLAGGFSTSFAQSTVTVYGIADAAVRYADGLTTGNAPSKTSQGVIASGVDNTSRLGFRGSEDLGGGMKAIFNVEMGINLATGATSDAVKIFDRASYLGIENTWGTVTVGRQTTVLADTLSMVDPLGVRFAGFNPNVGIAALSAHGLGIEFGPSGSTAGAYRLDSSIKYVGRFSDFTVRAQHGMGTASNLTGSGVSLAYGGKSIAGTLAYGQFKSATGLTLNGYLGGVSVPIGNHKLSATYGSHEAETTATARTRNTTLSLGGTLALTNSIDLVLGHYRIERTRTALANDGYNRTIAVLEQKLSRRTRIYGELDLTNWNNNYQGAANNSNATGLSVGILHTF